MFVVGLVVVTFVIVALDVITGTALRLFPLLIFLPAIVSALGAVWQTVVASAWVLVVEVCTAFYLRAAPAEILLAVGFTGVFGVLSVIGCRYRVSREDEVYRLRSAATALQELIVRPLPLRTAQVTMDGLYHPVEEEAAVGGDIYDVAVSRRGTRVIIADVQGKGLSAIGTALALLGSFREAAYREETLTGVVAALENSVVRHNFFATRRGEVERLVTALVLDFGPETNESVEVVNCGHIPPYILHDGDAYQVNLGEPAVPLGLAALAKSPRRRVRFTFPYGATLLLCTDGVTEARDPGGHFYPLEERLHAWAEAPPGNLASTLGEDLRVFTRSMPRDDIAILSVRRTGPPPSRP
ncbi:PP2C family serine/threonine-protein phosphatase [Nonomuraea antimicrobica]|uniref:PP2C family serine/threonine-protein phosphatase n=1 Tax=Nonomuraea antimicrobica TaxID=561173 RepID=A0ABP7B872_9ACTN